MIIIFGKKNYEKLCKSLIIPGVGIITCHYRFLPIYNVKITYNEK